MEIKKLEVSEHSDSRRLYEEVFDEDSASFVEYYYTEKVRDNQIYTVKEDGGIRAMLHLNPYRLYVNGSEKDANYIVAVATQKEYRKRGYMASLLKRALKDMYGAGQAFTFLMPAAESIYLPFGFRTVCEQERLFYKEEDEKLPGTVITDVAGEDCEELAAAANESLSEHYQLFALRDAAYYQRLKKEYESEGGKLKLYRKDGRITDCRGYYPEDKEEPKEENPKIMIRITDVRRMLMSLSLRSLIGTCFCVTDPLIEENNRCLMLTGTEFSGVLLMEGRPENSEGAVDIAALTEFVFGRKTAEELCEEDGVRMSPRMREEMKKLIPLSKIYLNEVV